MSAPVCLLVNPSAGGGRARRAAPAVERALRELGLEVRRADTRELDHARELARQAASAGETVAVLSGDGMIGAVVDVLREVPGAVLGILPGGRGNDLARVLGIPEDPVAACATIAHGTPRAIDLGVVIDARSGEGGRAFVGIASVGFDSDANRIANEAPSWLGGLVYAYAALRALVSWRPARFEIELDPPGERRGFTGYSVGAANSKAYGGGMRAAPDALLDDGLLEVVVLESVSKLTFVTRILPRVFKGTHVQLTCVRAFRAAEVSISADRPFAMYADGDPIGELPVRVRALQGAVTVLVPAGHEAGAAFCTPPTLLVGLDRRSPRRAGPAAGGAMARLLETKLALARAVGALSRLRGGGATSAPGKILLRLEPDALRALGSRLGQGSVLISATNGKTTTAAMAASILQRAGLELVHNQAGANMAGGIASTLLSAARPRGRIAGELGLFEVDELWLAPVAAQLGGPRAILLSNLFRDQLDRYGELEAIADSWAAALHDGPGQDAELVLNADDPLVADLGRERGERVVYFGVEDDSLALAGMAHAADAKHCRRCGAPYAFDAVYLGHLGHYHCPSCGQRRPAPQVTASGVALQGVRSSSFTLRTPAGEAQIALGLPGLYNVYNALAAAALATALHVPLEAIAAGLQSAQAAFGRAETVIVDGRELRILLVKNPAGANEVLRTLALEPGEHDLLGALNDNIADGRDVSWIWDADFELLAGRVRHAVCSGTRAPELAVRLKYAGIDPSRIAVRPDLSRALDEATADLPDAEDRAPLYALPTYTAMLSLRELLVARGHAPSAFS
ncbi:MAG TPA: YegS/Rv2252/BmrU family lipid kinase [Solirubrobacteraceae bacterium]|nr:YegS/Rv2252/BmrU family lipid kinase [Solirubrobacteraceae bacterium]